MYNSYIKIEKFSYIWFQWHYFQYNWISFIFVLNWELRYENISTCILYIKYLCILSTHVFSYLPLDVTDKRTSQQCTIINSEWQQHFCYNVWTLYENLVRNYDNHTTWNLKDLIFCFAIEQLKPKPYNWNRNNSFFHISPLYILILRYLRVFRKKL